VIYLYLIPLGAAIGWVLGTVLAEWAWRRRHQ
jgi:hypothetical protein